MLDECQLFFFFLLLFYIFFSFHRKVPVYFKDLLNDYFIRNDFETIGRFLRIILRFKKISMKDKVGKKNSFISFFLGYLGKDSSLILSFFRQCGKNSLHYEPINS